MLSKQKQAQYRQNLIGIDFLPCPPQQQMRVFITGQILSAQNFPDSQMFIQYKISLPEGWKTQKLEQFSNVILSQQQDKELNCLQSMTHSVFPVVQKNQEGGVFNKFYFCFPIDIQLIVHQKVAQRQWPRIHFQVFSKDYWNRIYMHGCGFVQFPSQQGSHVIKTETWRPSLDTRSKVSEFFLGGLVRPKNIQDISKSQMVNQLDKEGPINRIMFKTQSSGTIKTRLNIATQRKQVKIDQRVNFKTYKFSEQTQKRKGQLSQMESMPSSFNTGIIGGNRNTNTRLI